MKCVSCERPLLCAECGKPFTPANEAQFRAIHEAESAIACPACNVALACKWCGHAYSGDESEFGQE